MHIYRRLLLGVTNNIVYSANVLLQDNSEIVAIIPSVQEKIDFIYEQYELDIEQVNVDTEVMSEYKTKVIEYISGYVVKKMKCKVKCQKCIDCLTTAKPTDSSNLISVKDYGNFMVYPSTFVKKICEIAEKTILIEIENGNWLGKKYFFDFICLKIVNICMNLHQSLLQSLDEHGYDLMKKIVSIYSCLRLKRHAKLENQKIKKKRLRAKLSKIILQIGQ